MARAGIALGSNLGDRHSNLRIARDRVKEWHQGDESAIRTSSLYETAPVDCAPGTASFLNAVIEIETDLSPASLLVSAQSIETELGRAAVRARNAPRAIDVDILYFGDCQLESEALTLPHPRLHERRFVLAPLAEIAPDLKLPGSDRSIASVLENLSSPEPMPDRLEDGW